MVMHGHGSTIAATVDLMALHTEAVARAVKGKLVVADMPFLSVRKGLRPPWRPWRSWPGPARRPLR